VWQDLSPLRKCFWHWTRCILAWYSCIEMDSNLEEWGHHASWENSHPVQQLFKFLTKKIWGWRHSCWGPWNLGSAVVQNWAYCSWMHPSSRKLIWRTLLADPVPFYLQGKYSTTPHYDLSLPCNLGFFCSRRRC
jgi:hypothetical protein